MKQPTTKELHDLNRALGNVYYDDGECPVEEFSIITHFLGLAQTERKCFALLCLLGHMAEAAATKNEVNALLDESSVVDLYAMLETIAAIYTEIEEGKADEQSN